MGKRLLVSEQLICDVIKLINYLEFHCDYGDFIEVKRICSGIQAEIFEKFEKLKLRKAYTAYKTAVPGPERESLRRDYIELAQIRNSFTTSNEIPYCLLK
jgi:hypothetical protein